MSSSKSECRKFSPNIFNRSKCQHCFASKDSHSAEALDSNRVTRKVSKCGYLFVAPDWDFSNPLNRTKRWQRRWFVLYDDGELTYSVDEHPDTVPQAIIDMTKVLEVTNAEDVTGNKFAIALTAPEKVHFIKGTSREESQWWFHELAVFPRSIKNSRYKRNATFPGGKASVTKPLESLIRPEESLHSQSESQLSRRRFLSCDAHEPYKEKDIILMQTPIRKKEETFNNEDSDIEIINCLSSAQDTNNEDKAVSTKKNESLVVQTSPSISIPNDKVRMKHLLKREKRSPLNSRSHSDTVSYMIQKSFEIGSKHLKNLQKNNSQKKEQHLTSMNTENHDEAKQKSSSTRQQYHNDKNLEITRRLTGTNTATEEVQSTSQESNYIKPSLDNNQNYYIPNTDFTDSEQKNAKCLLLNHSERNLITSENADQLSSSLPQKVSVILPENNFTHSEQVRGDPDGMSSFYNCPSNEHALNCSEDYLKNIKKGWLMLQKSNKDSTKHWFVLKPNTLTYYQDPLAESKNIIEGFLELIKISNIEEIESPRHGFCITLKDNQKVKISAHTNSIRTSWIDSIKKMLEPKEWNKESTLSLGEKIEKEISLIKDLENNMSPHEEQKQTNTDNLSSPRSDMSSDDEFKTASETSGRMEDYFEWADEDADHNSSSRALPPSPPLNRTPISRVKERARTRSNTRVTTEKKERKRIPSNETNVVNSKDDFLKDDQSGSDRELLSSTDLRKRIRQKKSEKRKPFDDVKQHEVEGGKSPMIKNSSITDLRLNISNLENQIDDLNKQLKAKNYELSAKNERITELEKFVQHEDNLNQHNADERIPETSFPKLCETLEQRLALSENKILDLLSEMDFIYQSHQQYVDTLTSDLQKLKLENEDLKRDLEYAYSQRNESERTASQTKDEIIKQYENEILSLKSLLNNETNVDTVVAVEKFKKKDGNGVLPKIHLNSEDLTMKNDYSDHKISFPSFHKSNATEIETISVEDCSEVQKKLTRAMNEIRFLKQELRTSHEASDDLELQNIKLKQDLKKLDEDYASQMSLMTVRVDDLTSKLSCSEKNNRQLKQKVMRQDNKEQRRTRSLKGKESFTISKEMENKLEELERKIGSMEKKFKICDKQEICTKPTKVSTEINRDANETLGTKPILGTPESSSSDPMKLLVRMNNLETKVQGAVERLKDLKISSDNSDEIALCLNDVSFPDKTSTLDNKQSGEVQFENQRLVSAPPHISSLLTKCTKIAEEHLAQCNCGQIQGWELILNTLKEIKKQFENGISRPFVGNYQIIHHTVLRLKNLLQKKIHYWDEKRTSLKNYGLTSPKAILELWVERILSETFLMGKISCLLHQLNERENIMQLKEARNCYFKMVYLEKKLQRLKVSILNCNSSALQNESSDFNNHSLQNAEEIFSKIIQHEEILNKLFEPYKISNVKTLGTALAFKTLTRSQSMEENNDVVNNEQVIEPRKILPPNNLSQKLVEAEIHRIVSSFSKLFENKIFLELEMMFYPLDDHNVNRELHFKIVRKQLTHDMNLILQDLQESYQESLNKIQQTNQNDSSSTNDVTTKLAEFICTVAQNAVVVGHFNYLKETFKSISDHEAIPDDKCLSTLCDLYDVENNVMNVDIDEYLSQNDALKDELKYILPYLNEKFPLRETPLNRYVSVQDILQKTFDGKPSYFMNSYEARLQRSFRQRGQRSVTMPICTADSTMTDNKTCGNCQTLQEEIKSLKAKHSEALKTAKVEYEQSIASVETKCKEDISAVEKNYRDSIKALQDQICKMEKKQIGKQEEYDQEITALKETYEQEIVQKIDTKINEEAIRQRYQAEIEQLRGLCEKGLIAMENSHRRIIAELEEKHRQELEVLQVEKEQALAEETQATLAALDAMRKAHEVELQREIAKFKEEFLQKMQSSHEKNIIHKEHEGEMENIKQEILSLSEKYSIKCLENASLEERLEPLTRQLADANTLIFDLTARNKQLRAMLEISSAELQTILEAKSVNDLDDLKKLKIQLHLKENELLSEKEKIAELQQKLSTTKKNELILDNQCRLLDQSLKAERRLREDEVSSLRDRLEHIILTSNAPSKGSNNPNLFNHEDISLLHTPSSESKKKSINSFFGNELSRSPSCPGLNDNASYPSAIPHNQLASGIYIRKNASGLQKQ